MSKITFELVNVEYSLVTCGKCNIIIHNKTKYINVDAMCKNFNKKYSDWVASSEGKEITKELKKFNKMPYRVNKSDDELLEGTFAHSSIATLVAKWISNELFVIVNEIIIKSYYNDNILLKPKTVRKVKAPFLSSDEEKPVKSRVVKKVKDDHKDDEKEVKPKKSIKEDDDKPKKSIKSKDDDKPKSTKEVDISKEGSINTKEGSINTKEGLIKEITRYNKKNKECVYLLESVISKLEDLGYDNYVSCSEYEEVKKADISKLEEKELTKILNGLKKKFKKYNSNLKTGASKVSDRYGNSKFEEDYCMSSD